MKTINSCSIISVLFFWLLLSSCEEVHSISVQNDSADTVCIVLSGSSCCDVSSPIRDTLIRRSWGYKTLRGSTLTEPMGKYSFHFFMRPFYDYIEEVSGSDTLSIYVFESSVMKVDSLSIIPNDLILVRYDFSIEDAKSLGDEHENILISYPPNDAMRRIRMWPTFDSITRRERKK